MGIARGAVALLLEEASRRPFHGKLATLGRQTLYTTATEIARQFEKFKVTPKGVIDAKRKDLCDEDLFGWMGFDAVESLDYSDFEGATHIIDLNKESIPSNLVEAYDVVLDSGTLEHIFHFPNALKNTLSLLKVGGRMIFLTPSSNHLDHGFYMFSPTLFADYFAVNGFRIETIYVVRYSGNLDEMWDAYAYQPGQWRDLHTGGLDDRPYAIWVVATRLERSTIDAIPQQGYYADSSPLYVGSHLAGSGAQEQTAGQVDSLDSPMSLCQFVRVIPRAHMIWRILNTVRVMLWRKLGVPSPTQQPRYAIFEKPWIGQY